jgi:hypothetical protein
MCSIALAETAADGSAVTFQDSFETHAPGDTVGGGVPETGDSWTRLAGEPDNMTVQNGVGINGSQAVRFTRPPGAQQAVRGECDPRTGRIQPHTQTTIHADVFLKNTDQSARLALEPRGYPGFKPTVWMKPGGAIEIWESRDGSEWRGKWVDTGAKTHAGWQTIDIVITWGPEHNRRIEGTYSVTIAHHQNRNENGTPKCIAENIPTLAVPVNTLLDVMIDTTDYGNTQTPGDTVWDDVRLSTSETEPTIRADTPRENKPERNE